MNLTQALKVIANDRRLQILQWLKDPGAHFTSTHCDVTEVGVCVGLIEEKIGLSQSTVSQYLTQLQQAGFITMERQGQWTYCKINRPFIEQFITQLKHAL